MSVLDRAVIKAYSKQAGVAVPPTHRSAAPAPRVTLPSHSGQQPQQHGEPQDSVESLYDDASYYHNGGQSWNDDSSPGNESAAIRPTAVASRVKNRPTRVRSTTAAPAPVATEAAADSNSSMNTVEELRADNKPIENPIERPIDKTGDTSIAQGTPVSVESTSNEIPVETHRPAESPQLADPAPMMAAGGYSPSIVISSGDYPSGDYATANYRFQEVDAGDPNDAVTPRAAAAQDSQVENQNYPLGAGQVVQVGATMIRLDPPQLPAAPHAQVPTHSVQTPPPAAAPPASVLQTSPPVEVTAPAVHGPPAVQASSAVQAPPAVQASPGVQAPPAVQAPQIEQAPLAVPTPQVNESVPPPQPAMERPSVEENLAPITAETVAAPPVESPPGVESPAFENRHVETAAREIPSAPQPPAPEPPTVEPPVELTPAWEVDRFMWPHVCEDLLAQRGAEIDLVGQRMLATAAQGRNIVAVSSFSRNEGRTSFTLCLARWACAAGLKIALVDGDLQHPSLANQLGMNPPAGWENVITHGEPIAEAAVASLEDGLTMLPVQNAQSSPELIMSQAAANVLTHIARSYDLVLVDAAPIGSDQQQTAVARYAARPCPFHAAVVVCDVRRTNTDQINEALAHLEHRRLPVLAVIENFSNR